MTILVGRQDTERHETPQTLLADRGAAQRRTDQDAPQRIRRPPRQGIMPPRLNRRLELILALSAGRRTAAESGPRASVGNRRNAACDQRAAHAPNLAPRHASILPTTAYLAQRGPRVLIKLGQLRACRYVRIGGALLPIIRTRRRRRRVAPATTPPGTMPTPRW